MQAFYLLQSMAYTIKIGLCNCVGLFRSGQLCMQHTALFYTLRCENYVVPLGPFGRDCSCVSGCKDEGVEFSFELDITGEVVFTALTLDSSANKRVLVGTIDYTNIDDYQ